MKLNRTELRKIIYDFNSISNRLMQADYSDYNDVLSKFLKYIRKTAIINDYIIDCGTCTQNLEEEFREVSTSYGRCIFSLGDTDEEEICNVYAILNYIVEHNIEVAYGIAMGYSSSKKLQDKVRGFNDRVVMVLIRHIECHLTKIGIDMGLDEKTTYTITVHNGQVNVANDNATISAVNNSGVDRETLTALIQNIRAAAQDLSPQDIEMVSDSLETIETEATSDRPKKGLLRIAIEGIKAVKGTAEFGAAVVTLIQFLQTVFPG